MIDYWDILMRSLFLDTRDLSELSSDRNQHNKRESPCHRLVDLCGNPSSHSHYLMNLVEKEDCIKDGDQTDPASPTIFTEACCNDDYIEIWNDFMNRSGEEQEKFLHYLEGEAKKKSKRKVCSNSQDAKGEHSGCTGKECFQRIDRRLRITLRRRQIPMGTLEFLEEDLTRFFAMKPQSVYRAMLENSYERLLLHALCQYLDLISQSSDCNGKRQTEVSNKGTDFLPPVPLLSVYLEQQS